MSLKITKIKQNDRSDNPHIHQPVLGMGVVQCRKMYRKKGGRKMIREVTMYQAVCDRCGRPCAETGGIMAWANRESHE